MGSTATLKWSEEGTKTVKIVYPNDFLIKSTTMSVQHVSVTGKTFIVLNKKLQFGFILQLLLCSLSLNSYSWRATFRFQSDCNAPSLSLSGSQKLVSFPNISARFLQGVNTFIQAFLLRLTVVFTKKINTILFKYPSILC